MKLVIGLAGRIGSGKTSISKYIERKYGARQIKFSQILMDILDRLHVEKNRENLQKLGAGLRNVMGKDVIVNAFEKDLESLDADIIVIDGIRYMNEIEMLRRFENNILIFVDVPPEIRYERVRGREEKSGESSTSYEEFLKAEQRETERYIDRIRNESDYAIDNTDTLENFYDKVNEILKKYV